MMSLILQGEGISVKEMQDQLVTVQTLEYHNLNLSWRALLLELKKDYKSAIIAQVSHNLLLLLILLYYHIIIKCNEIINYFIKTIKSAIGMKESEEKAGLSSPKIGRYVIIVN